VYAIALPFIHPTDLAKTANVKGKIQSMYNGDRINTTENRAVLHVALRALPTATHKVDGKNVMPAVHKVLKQIKTFTDEIRRYTDLYVWYEV